MRERLLPIGSVVLLKESDARVMISGYLPVAKSNIHYAWDYSGFKFPIGYVNDDDIYCFNHDQIDEIVQYGFQDYEGIQFVNKLEEIKEDVKKSVKENREE